MIFYWSAPAFWSTIVVLVILLIMVIFDKDGNEDEKVAKGLLIVFLIIAMTVANFCERNEAWRSKVISDIRGEQNIEERTYHQVTFLGKKSTIFNYSDARWYVNMGNGSMISYNKIMNESMCRRCEQFKEGSMIDSIYVYVVQKDPPKWYNEGPVMFFSKYPDLFLESVKKTPIKT
jgi:hypothetical protein